MPIFAVWTMPTKSPVIPWAVFDLLFRINVQEWTLLVAALAKFGKEVAFWHFAHVIFMQKFTVIPLLTESSQPMFTHDCSVTFHMTKRTGNTFAADALYEKHAYGRTRLVHAGEGKWLSSDLLIYSDFNFKFRQRCRACYYFLHL